MTNLKRSNSVWQDQYVALIHRPDNKTQREAERLKDQHIPRSIFRFREATERNLQNLRICKIWLASCDCLDDPFEVTFFANLEPIIAKAFVRRMAEDGFRMTDREKIEALVEGARSISEMMANLVRKEQTLTEAQVASDAKRLAECVAQAAKERVAEMRQSYQREMKVCCFSECVDSIPMWSLYAKDATGYCLEYEMEALPPDHPFRVELFPVLYADAPLDATNLLPTYGAGYDTDDFNIIPILAAMYKSKRWEDQREWRLIARHPEIKGGMEKPSPLPTAIYLGPRIDSMARSKLLAVAKDAKISVFQTRLSDTSYSLSWAPIST